MKKYKKITSKIFLLRIEVQGLKCGFNEDLDPQPWKISLLDARVRRSVQDPTLFGVYLDP